MGVRALGAAAVLAVGLAGCSSAQSTAPVAQPTGSPSSAAPTSSAATDAGPTTTTPAQPVYSVSATYSQVVPPPDKPVAALLAGLELPITAANMPKARPEWVAAVSVTSDEGKPLASQPDISVNLVALVDEAAKTSDLDSLVKLCFECDMNPTDGPVVAQKIKTLLTARDSRGLSGFQQLSSLMEKSHPAFGQLDGWIYPGFGRPQKGAATTADQADMKVFGYPYTGFMVQFARMDDGSGPEDAFFGLFTRP